MVQAFEDTGDVFLVAADAIQGLCNNNVEGILLGVVCPSSDKLGVLT
jgi:hypothetical protein